MEPTNNMQPNIVGLKPIVQRKMNVLLATCHAEGFPIRITQGLRTHEEQAALFAQGRTRPGPIVTNAKPGTSNHEFGCAFDVCFDNTSHPYDGPWDKVIAAAEKIGLENGDMGYHDTPHFEVRNGYTDAQIISGQVDWSKWN